MKWNWTTTLHCRKCWTTNWYRPRFVCTAPTSGKTTKTHLFVDKMLALSVVLTSHWWPRTSQTNSSSTWPAEVRANNFKNHRRNRNKNSVLPALSIVLARTSPTAISCQRSFHRALGSWRPAALLQTLSSSSSIKTSQKDHCSPRAAGICVTYHHKPNKSEIVHIL